MKLSLRCKECLLKKQRKAAESFDETLKKHYLTAVEKMIDEFAEKEASPCITARIRPLYAEYFGVPYPDDFKMKPQYNALMLEHEKTMRADIKNAPDTILYALRLAAVGNYIDFGAQHGVDDSELESLLKSAGSIELNAKAVGNFKNDLKKAKKLVYLTDNCGEIVCDKLLIEEMQKYNKALSVTVIVRGGPVINDACADDAEQVGLTALQIDVIGSGCAIAGTPLEYISREAREKIENADIIISKGQGNFETLFPCGLNVYYLFLCKCANFTEKFGLPELSGVFINEKELNGR